MNPKFWLSVVFFMSRIGIFEAAGQCHQKESSMYGMFLRGHTFKMYQVGWPLECYLRCDEEVKCQSYNFDFDKMVCELNNRTKEARPEDFKPDQTRFYVTRQNNRVPLGSIRELPAESCSEIKASEGYEMVDGDYWIYSNGNDQTILVRCEVNWQKINTEPVCFGAQGDQYGAFNITKSGCVEAMKLVHRSGTVKCNPVVEASYWGCQNSAEYGNNGLQTIITDANKESVLPPVQDLKALSYGCLKTPHFYYLSGTTHTSPELVFRDLPNPLSVSRNQELQIWYGQDLFDCYEDDNLGTTCVDVYAWYV